MIKAGRNLGGRANVLVCLADYLQSNFWR